MRSGSHWHTGQREPWCDSGGGWSQSEMTVTGALSLHDLQHPAQNTAQCSGQWPDHWQPLAWDVSGELGDSSKCQQREAQRHCYTPETHSDWDVTTGIMSVWSIVFADRVGVCSNMTRSCDSATFVKTLIGMFRATLTLTYIKALKLTLMLPCSRDVILANFDVIGEWKNLHQIVVLAALACPLLRMMEFFRKFARNLFVRTEPGWCACERAVAGAEHIIC